MDHQLRFIGVVRSRVQDRRQMPPLGAPAAVELDPENEPGLLRMEKHSHFWVLAWLIDRAERSLYQVTPRGVEPDAPDAAHGVFAVRSPARPNPIGLTAARLVSRDGPRLEFDLLDFIDGTPVLDLKPYFASRDVIFAAHNATIGKPRTREAMRESLLLQAMHYCGALHPDAALAVQIIEQYRVEVCDLGEPPEWSVSAPAHRPHLVDALIGITRVRLARGLRLTTGDAVELNGWRYRLPPP